MVKWGITMTTENTQDHIPEFIKFWCRMEELSGHPIRLYEIQKIVKRMNMFKKENKNDRCKSLP